MNDMLNMPLMVLCGITIVSALVPASNRGVSGGVRGRAGDGGDSDGGNNDGDAATAQTHDGASRWPRRALIAAAALALIVLAYLVELFIIDFDTDSTALETPLSQLFLIAYATLVVRIPAVPGTYVAIWAQIMSSLLNECVDLLTMWMPGDTQTVGRIAVTIVACVPHFLLCRGKLAPWLQTDGRYQVGRRKLVFAAAVDIIFLLLSNYQLIFLLLGSRSHSYMVPAFRLLVGALSLLTLHLQNDIEQRQRAQTERDMVERLWASKQAQYEISKETIDIINRKCHDLKYQLAAFRTMHDDAEIDRKLGEVEQSVMIYDSAVQTGNRVLDVVLTEKSLYCEEHRITMTCMADASRMDFIEQTDLYAMFGNALDNAIESVMRQDDPAKRIIQVSVRPEHGFLFITFRNYCDEPVEMKDGLPVTSKTGEKGYHGYGLRGIRHTAEQYGGTMDVTVTPESFTLQVILPLGFDAEAGGISVGERPELTSTTAPANS